MSVKNLLLWEKWRPKRLEDIILLPRIKKQFENGKNIDKLFECNYVIADYTSKLETNTDPIVLGMTIIGKFRDILK